MNVLPFDKDILKRAKEPAEKRCYICGSTSEEAGMKFLWPEWYDWMRKKRYVCIECSKKREMQYK